MDELRENEILKEIDNLNLQYINNLHSEIAFLKNRIVSLEHLLRSEKSHEE
jgi:hypothetical protein